MTSTTKIMLACTVLLTLTYGLLFAPASHGYGYMGYRGYHSGPSFWYWGGPTTYAEPSNRSGSVNGTDRVGGGPGSGK
ncbi:MAG: hypothetical protein EAZ74_06310 [Alphaproteobacteria bacterium]|nr:MAG: hypothetical protein EAY76_01470 [Alphaproteobacteria bacterium]TAF13159.1 MAG: hypothetical protein EAZ74_06310 [Alphaproteobacteria bacterium]TAF75782.1 MAG: hypothetical protein EAZ52_05840 [Alphaproteobacteria bacterium]